LIENSFIYFPLSWDISLLSVIDPYKTKKTNKQKHPLKIRKSDLKNKQSVEPKQIYVPMQWHCDFADHAPRLCRRGFNQPIIRACRKEEIAV
jgi:hypothetical protein